MLIQFQCEEKDLAAALDAIFPFASGRPKVFAERSVPASPLQSEAFEKEAQEIAKWIQPRDSCSISAETIRFVLTGSDTHFDLQGDPDPALRNATGALSKRLRKFAKYSESPLEILCERRREVYPSGPYKGRYRGTRYRPTKLGKRVFEILKDSKAI